MEPSWRLPQFVGELVQHPPEGYNFLARKSGRRSGGALQGHLLRKLQEGVSRVVPLQLLMSQSRGLMRHQENLTYALTHVVLRSQPWVLDMITEQPHLLISPYSGVTRYANIVRRALLSEACKGILCWCRASRNALLQRFGGDLADKTKTIYWGVPVKRFTKEYNEKTVKLLFINSANINTGQHFFAKGGLEVLHAFVRLRKKYSNLELTIRSGMPEDLRVVCNAIPGVRVYHELMPQTALEQEWRSANIFVLPNRYNTPAMSFLEAMSYELPIVTTEIWANPELVKDGETGFTVSHPYTRQYNACDPALPWSKIPTTVPYETTVGDLVRRLELLIENHSWGLEMGKKARRMVESGQFSTEKRNERLKRFLDSAVSG